MIERETHPFIDSLLGKDHRWSGKSGYGDGTHPECKYTGCHRQATPTTPATPHWGMVVPEDREQVAYEWYRDVCRRHEIEMKIGWALSIPLTPLILLYLLTEYVVSQLRAYSEGGDDA